MKMILFNQNPMIAKLLESVSKKLELSMENFNHYQELSTRLKEDSEWILIADDECLEKLDQVDWLELKEIISQNKNSVCMYKKGNEAQPFLEGFEMKIKKPFLPTEVLKILQKKLGSNMSELEPSQNLDPTQEVLETNWDELENLGDLEALVQEEPNNEEQLLPTLNAQEEKEEIKEEKEEIKEEKEEIKETPQEEEKPKDDEVQESETQKNEEVSKELETQEELEIPKEETQEQAKEQEPTKEETQENKEEKQEKTQDSPSAQELEAMQELVKEIQENSNGQKDKKETQESTEIPQEETQENAETPQETEKQELETQEKTQENAETPQETEKQESAETPQETEKQESAETPQETEKQESAGTPQEKTQKLETQEDHYESIEDIPEPVMAKAMGEELPFLNEAVAKIPNNENDTETPKESVIKTPQEKEESIETPKESDKTSSPLELRLNLQDLLNSLNQESLKSLLENKTLSIKITLEDKKPDA
ncbi:chemotaxis regulatory protein ChePep [Helicobacter pylori]